MKYCKSHKGSITKMERAREKKSDETKGKCQIFQCFCLGLFVFGNIQEILRILLNALILSPEKDNVEIHQVTHSNKQKNFNRITTTAQKPEIMHRRNVFRRKFRY